MGWAAPSDWVPGILSPPEPDWPHIEPVHVEDLRAIAASLLAKGRHPVVFFDSMDRMSDDAAFSAIVAEDVAAFRDCGVGVVLVGPLRSLEGFGRIDADRFDHFLLRHLRAGLKRRFAVRPTPTPIARSAERHGAVPKVAGSASKIRREVLSIPVSLPPYASTAIAPRSRRSTPCTTYCAASALWISLRVIGHDRGHRSFRQRPGTLL